MKKASFTNSISLAVILIALTAFSGQLFANNMQVTDLSFSQANSTVTFTLSWDHSWRNSSAVPNNWDAAWVFVKWRDCSAPVSTDYTHGRVSETTTDHTFNVGTTLEPTKRDGTAGIDASTNNTGVMLRNSVDNASSSGSVSSTVTLKLVNPLPASGTLDVRVFAIEMVYIPQGSFTPGDCSGTSSSTWTFTGSTTACSGGATPAITSENGITLREASTGTGICPSGVCSSINAAFPKGFGTFYMMKYEITQGQYVDFLNGTFLQAQLNRYPGNNANNRHTITNTNNAPNIYVAARPDRACNYLSWDDVAAYLDWAALRPLTELEYEKSCRGPNPTVLREMAWGTSSGRAAQTISGTENGTETITDFGANVAANGGATYGNSDMTPTASAGPLRVGIFALPTSNTRVQTGAGYYGNMDLSGNVAEFYISILAGNSTNVSSAGIGDGDGILSATGLQNQTATSASGGWPPSNTGTAGLLIVRGGSFLNGSNGGICSTCASNLAVSFRYDSGTFDYGWSSLNTSYRDPKAGGRGGR